MVFEETTEVYEHMDHKAMPKLPAEIAESNSLAVFNFKLLPQMNQKGRVISELKWILINLV